MKKSKYFPLSIIVTIHDTNRKMDNLLSWILDSRLRRMQIILVHDKISGEDDLPDILKVPTLKNYQVISGKFGSPGASRNAGLSVADGEYVVFWDFDDRPIVDEFLEFFNDIFLSKSEIGIGGYRVIRYASDEVLGTYIFPTMVPSEAIFFTFKNPGIWRWIFKKSTLGETKFRHISLAEDQLFLAEISAHNKKITVRQTVIYEYVIGDPNQLTNAMNDYSELEIALKNLDSIMTRATDNTKIFCIIAKTLILRKLSKNYLSKDIFKFIKFVLSFFFFMLRKSRSIYPFRHCLTFDSIRLKKKEQSVSVHFFGGLGNQLFQFSLALNLSKSLKVKAINANPKIKTLFHLMNYPKPSKKTLTQNDIEFFDSTSFAQTKFRNLCIRLSSLASTKSGIVNLSLHRFLMKILRLIFLKVRILFPMGLGYDNSLIQSIGSKNVTIIGYLQTFMWAQHVKFEISEALNKYQSNLKTNLDLEFDLPPKSSIYVQMRLGDYSKNQSLGLLDIAYFDDAIAKFISMKSPNKVTLFSDEIDLAHFRIAGARSIPTQFVSDVKSLEDELLDLFVFSQGAMYCISNSTFGWWGAFLSNASENGMVAFPVPWFRSLQSPELLIPENWMPISSSFAS